MIGTLLGHYRILEEIGAGGMGVVYRARDERLERDVAVKVLPAGTLADEAARHRFRKEALALSRVNHANIAAVYDFDTQDGVDFLVMELVSGTTLDTRLAASGALTEPEAVRLGTQLARGLAAAHEKGVVHRDLKPGNLRLTRDGELKILDFGLARLLDPVKQAGGPGTTTGMASTLTASGTDAYAGTVPYMAPEQLRGERADARSDLYAAGAVLYELCTGKRPFPQTHGPLLIDAILNQPPLPPSSQHRHLSPALESIILKALDKDPERRYQSARELRVDLERVASPHPLPVPHPGPKRRWTVVLGGLVVALCLLWIVPKIVRRPHGGQTRIQALAVLPLVNLSGDPKQEYFVDGMTDELIAEIGKIGALRVISRTSAMLYKNVKKSLPQIAKELHVDAVVQGSVRRSQGHVRVSAQLIEAASDRHLWSEGYEREEQDVLAIQNEVARAIAHEIRVQLTPEEQARLGTPRPVNPRAHELDLEGRSYADHLSKENLNKAVSCFNEAIGIDPGYAPAYAGLAQVYYNASTIYVAPADAMPKVRAAATRALELDPGRVDAQVALGYVKSFYEWNWSEGERDLRRAVQLGPSDANAHWVYGYFLEVNNRFDEAIVEMRKARELDPLSALITAYSLQPLYEGRRYDAAIEAALKLVDTMDPASWPFANVLQVLGQAYLQKRQYPEAIAALRKASDHEAATDYILPLATLGSAYAASGQKKEALEVLQQLQARSRAMQDHAYPVATLYAALGDRDEAFAWLAKSIDSRTEEAVFLRVDPQMDALRSDPRFPVLLRKLGFPFD
jgi:serine/threonine protein kinase/tetratricopeptide (TPR) repeat protein